MALLAGLALVCVMVAAPGIVAGAGAPSASPGGDGGASEVISSAPDHGAHALSPGRRSDHWSDARHGQVVPSLACFVLVVGAVGPVPGSRRLPPVASRWRGGLARGERRGPRAPPLLFSH